MLLDDFWAHRCADRRILLRDDPQRLRLGYACACGEETTFALSEVKARRLHPILQEFMSSYEKRLVLARIIERLYLIVYDEKELS